MMNILTVNGFKYLKFLHQKIFTKYKVNYLNLKISINSTITIIITTTKFKVQ